MKYFTISEMLKSDTARKHGIWNGATKEHEENLRALIENVLDPLRERYGKPLRVTSGYRCPKLNNLVGGTPNSQHMRGEAADIVAMSISTRDCGSASAMRVSGGGMSKGSIVPNDPSAPKSPHGGEASAIPQAAGGQNDTPKTARGVGPSTLRPGSATAGSGTLVSTEENKKLGHLIEELGNFDQLIYEQCDKNGTPRWIHVSYKRNGWNRKQVLVR